MKFQVEYNVEHKSLPQLQAIIIIEFEAEDPDDSADWWQKPEVVEAQEQLDKDGWWVTTGDPVDITPVEE